MKIRVKYLLLLILTLFVQFSCKDWMEISPYTGLTREEFWKSKEDVSAVVMGTYASLASMNAQLFKYGEMRAEMVEGRSSLPDNEKKIMEGSIYPDNGFCNWQNFYKVINYCNEVIAYAPVVQEKDNTFNDYIMYGYLSEVYFIRSLCYFYLVRIYKDVPLVLEPTLTDASDIYLPKTDGNEILDHITADLEMARSWATIDGYKTIAENKGRATKAAIDALLADIALWTYDYEACINHVNNIEFINMNKLVPEIQWFYLFSLGNTLEGIFELQFDDALAQGNLLYDETSERSYKYGPSDRAVEIFIEETELGSVRGEGRSIKKLGEDNYLIYKYIGFTGGDRPSYLQRSANFIIYRYADVLLMKAEALSQLGRYTEALDIINTVRDRVGLNPVSPADSPTAYEDVILDERARELAFEGKRWFDVLRMGRRNDFSRRSKLIEIIVSNVPSTQKRIMRTKLTNPLSWYLPIYETEIERNQYLVQNPYYNF
jgi:tetratricopeptide (TPR) repeat protein